MIGAVYFVRVGQDGPVKIGWAIDPGRRLKELQTASAGDLQIVRVVPGDRRKESAFHHHYRGHRIKGEWFAWCDTMLATDPKNEPVADTSVSAVIERLGGPGSVKRQLGVPYSTIHSWFTRQSIPVEIWPRLVEIARETGVKGLTFDALVQAHALHKPRRKRKAA